MTTHDIHVALHGAPRSGTTWLGQILNSSPHVRYAYQPLFSYAFKGFLNEHSDGARIEEFFERIKMSDDAFINQRDPVIHRHARHFAKSDITHVVYKEVRYHHILDNLLSRAPRVRVLGLYRHPCAVLSSWRNAAREFDPAWDFETEWQRAEKKNRGRVEEFYGYLRWKELLRLFLDLRRRYPDRFQLVYYLDLVQYTSRVVEEIFAFLGLEVEEATREFILESTSREDADPYSVYRSRRSDDAWRVGFPWPIEREIMADLDRDGLAEYVR